MKIMGTLTITYKLPQNIIDKTYTHHTLKKTFYSLVIKIKLAFEYFSRKLKGLVRVVAYRFEVPLRKTMLQRSY